MQSAEDVKYTIALKQLKENDHNLLSLDLAHQDLYDAHLTEMSTALLINKNVKALFLNNNHFTDQGIIALASALQFQQSVELVNLEYNEVTENGISSLKSACHINRNIKQIGITLSGKRRSLIPRPSHHEIIAAVTKDLPDTTEAFLPGGIFAESMLTAAEITTLLNVIERNSPIIKLDLRYQVNFDLEHFDTLYPILMTHPSLSEVDLQFVELDGSISKCLQNAAKTNPRLKHVYITENNLKTDMVEAHRQQASSNDLPSMNAAEADSRGIYQMHETKTNFDHENHTCYQWFMRHLCCCISQPRVEEDVLKMNDAIDISNKLNFKPA